MTTADQLEIVEQLVLQERKIVTYGWLSRHLKIHSNKAKQLLYEFIAKYRSSNENSVHVIYCICGLTTSNNQHTVTLVTQEKLEAARKDFASLTSLHVYSVQPECPTEAELIRADRGPIDKVASESALLLNTNKDVSSATSSLVSQPINVKEESLNISVPPEKADEKPTFRNELRQTLKKPTKSKSITFEESKLDEQGRASKEEQTTEKSKKKITDKQKIDKASDIASILSKTASQDDTKTSSKKTKKQITNKQKSDNGSDIASLLNKAASQDELKTSNNKGKKRKSEEIEGNPSKLDVEEEKATNKQKNGKGDIGSLWNKVDSQNKVTTKDKVVKRRKNDEATDGLNQQEIEASKNEQITNKHEPDNANKPASHDSTAKKRRSDSMVEDDFNNNAAEKGSKQRKLHKVDKTDNTEQKQQEDAGDFMNVNNNEKNQSQDKLSDASVQQNALPTKKRGRRQVLKSRSYVNERGYTVHENYREWESFSEDESVPESSSKKQRKAIKVEDPNVIAKRGKKKKGDDGSQRSLLSFFGRK